jgi:hypothetical protein
VTGSLFKTDKAASNTLYGGDRAGSRFYWVLENTAATETAQAFSGTINPGIKNKVTAFQVNPFVKFRGAELFGVIEHVILPGLLAKAEYVKQTYFGYQAANIKSGGKFNGLMLEGVVAF